MSCDKKVEVMYWCIIKLKKKKKQIAEQSTHSHFYFLKIQTKINAQTKTSEDAHQITNVGYLWGKGTGRGGGKAGETVTIYLRPFHII